MAKKITRGITGIKEINKQDFDTNNVNDLLSDGQYNYIHRKKGKSEEYHNLTDNIKTISSDNTDLLTVTNNNKTNNTATLSPKHDAQKEQVLESERNTITIKHGANATPEKTKVDTNPEKVLEHDNLTVGSGLLKAHTAEQNTTNLSVDFNTVQQKMSAGDGLTISNNKISIKPTLNGNPLNNGFFMGNIIDDTIASSIISLQSESNRIVQLSFRESFFTPNLMIMKYRFIKDGTPTEWKDATIDSGQLSTLLAQKQNKIIASASIGVIGESLRQLYNFSQTYNATNGVLKTHVKIISNNSTQSKAEEEFNFILKINQGYQAATFTLNEHDKRDFNSIITTYGAGNSVRINGCLFELSDSTLTVSTEEDTSNNYVITFSDII